MRSKKKENPQLILSGLTPGMSVHYASCCNPIPGDSVLAFISQGKGLIIHNDRCDELKKIEISKTKLINVSGKTFLTKSLIL